MLASDFVLGIGNRWANRHTGSVDVYTKGRKFVHVDIEPTQIGRVFAPDYGIVSDAEAALELFVEVAREWKAAGKLKDRAAWVAQCRERKRTMLRKTNFDNVPMKPQRVYQCMNRAFDDRDTCYVTTIGLSQIAAAQFLHVYKPRNWINCGQAGPLGWTIPAALGVRAADPTRRIVALSGDYDFQFMIEELAVGAQFKLPYIHIVVNNSLPRADPPVAARLPDGLLRVSSRSTTSTRPRAGGYGVDHVKVVEGLGCKAIRVHRAGGDRPGDRSRPRSGWREYRVPVVIEMILERVTNIAMGTEIDNVVEFEELAIAGRRADRDRAARLTVAQLRYSPRHRHEGIDMPRFAANLTMLYTEVDVPRPLRAAARRPASRPSSSCSPMRIRRSRSPSGSTRNGWSWCCTTCRPATGQPASAASPAIRSASASSRTAWRRRSTTRRRSACRRSTAWPASRRQASTAARCARRSSPTCASPRRSSRRPASSC